VRGRLDVVVGVMVGVGGMVVVAVSSCGGGLVVDEILDERAHRRRERAQ
jgi:hypothetical protein